MNLKKLISGFRFASVGKSRLGRIGKSDLGVLKVAFMVAALDGEVTDAEYKAFDALAKKCRGYTPQAAATALEAAMRSAGYLMLLSQRVKEKVLVEAFLDEAQKALPHGFAYLSVADVRRAVVTWIAMGLSDGEYSRREKVCIEALRRHFAEQKAMKSAVDNARWLDLSTGIRQAYSLTAPNAAAAELVTGDFVDRVEELVRNYGDSGDAERELKALIGA